MGHCPLCGQPVKYVDGMGDAACWISYHRCCSCGTKFELKEFVDGKRIVTWGGDEEEEESADGNKEEQKVLVS